MKNSRKGKRFRFFFHGGPTLGDLVESLGVPHTEVGRVRVNQKKATLKRHLKSGDAIDIDPNQAIPGRTPKFILDVHLGKLARYLRIFGFDTLYKNDWTDRQIVELAVKLNRFVLTRDVGILKHKRIRKGYWVRQTDPEKQIRELMERLSLYGKTNPFRICLACNGRLRRVPKEKVADRLPLKTRQYFDRFYRCKGCHKIYWPGSHYERMKAFVEANSRSS
ncbi:MAG: hypothetical protein JW893_06450 [Candidatus Omnitrophica bacterium]|nr:hypothetical protein [Candidatus Omnitrophota bacterium]